MKKHCPLLRLVFGCPLFGRHVADRLGRTALFVATVIGYFATSSIVTADPLRIMPVGDSITTGYTDNPGWNNHPFEFGYRSGLYTRLADAGYDFQFVGGSTEPWTGISGDPTHGGTVSPTFDLRPLGQDGHRGYGGASIGAIQSGIGGWLAADDPDVILLMIGINGIGGSSPGQLNSLVDTIVTARPNARLIVAQITPLAGYNQSLVDYNTYIRETMVPAYAGQGYNVTTVDQYANMLTPGGTIDAAAFSNGINHPNNPAYDRMAQTWFDGIEALDFADPPDTDVVITTSMAPSQGAFSGDVSDSDLLHGLSGDHVSYNAFPGTRTNDGLHGGDTDTNGIAWAMDGDVTSSTFDLGVGEGQGWDITSITSIAAWNSAGFMNQKYDVSVRLVGAGAFTPLTSVDYQPFDAGDTTAGATKVVITDNTGTLAGGVEAIRFSVRDTNSNPAGGVTFREIDVEGTLHGTSEPPVLGVVNPSFEEPDIADATFVNGSFTGWTASGHAVTGVQDLPANESPAPTDGQQHGYASFASPSMLTQTLGDVITDGSVYTLTVDVGQHALFSGSEGTIRLFGSTLGSGTALSNANGTAELAGIAPAPGTYTTDVSVTYAALATGDPFAGQSIGIALINSAGTQVLFDNVRLDVVEVPEPCAFVLMALGGLLGMVELRRRKTGT